MSLRSAGPRWFVFAGRVLVEAGCAWEIAALHSKARIPTISQIVHRYRHEPATRLALLAMLAWLTHHLIIEEIVILEAADT